MEPRHCSGPFTFGREVKHAPLEHNVLGSSPAGPCFYVLKYLFFFGKRLLSDYRLSPFFCRLTFYGIEFFKAVFSLLFEQF